jgi:hypothetical protein
MEGGENKHCKGKGTGYLREDTERCKGSVCTLAAVDMPSARLLRSDCEALEKGMDMMVIPSRGRVLAVIWALALAGGLLTLALLAKPAQAQSQGAVSERLPVAFTLDASACVGELIDLTGTMHTVNHVTVQEDGTYHITSHFNLAGVKAVGQTTGDMYVVPSAGNIVENFVQPGQIVTGTVDINMVIGQGKIPNQNALARLHYIIGPDGELKTETVQFHFACRP